MSDSTWPVEFVRASELPPTNEYQARLEQLRRVHRFAHFQQRGRVWVCGACNKTARTMESLLRKSCRR